MAFYLYWVWLLWSAIVLSGSVFVESSLTQEGKQIHSPVNVTKRISFPSFKADQKLVHEVKLLGSAVFSDGEGAIRIPDESHASDLRHQAGRAIYSFPIRLLDPASRTPASFETSFSFQFSNFTSSADRTSELGNNTGGSGLTFVIVPDEFTVGRPGPWLAMLNDACEENYKAFAVEFDARENPEFGDPNDNHIGFNLGSIISTTTVNASDFGISLKDGMIHQAWISYDGLNRRIEVRLDSHPVYSGSLDLFPFLNEYMFVGFSASTGNMTQIHRIYSWNFTSTSQASLRVPSAETCESKIIHNYDREGVLNSESRSPSKPVPPDSLLIFISVMGFAIAAVAILFQIRRRKRDRTEVSVFPEKKQRPRSPKRKVSLGSDDSLKQAESWLNRGKGAGLDDDGGALHEENQTKFAAGRQGSFEPDYSNPEPTILRDNHKPVGPRGETEPMFNAEDPEQFVPDTVSPPLEHCPINNRDSSPPLRLLRKERVSKQTCEKQIMHETQITEKKNTGTSEDLRSDGRDYAGCSKKKANVLSQVKQKHVERALIRSLKFNQRLFEQPSRRTKRFKVLKPNGSLLTVSKSRSRETLESPRPTTQEDAPRSSQDTNTEVSRVRETPGDELPSEADQSLTVNKQLGVVCARPENEVLQRIQKGIDEELNEWRDTRET